MCPKFKFALNKSSNAHLAQTTSVQNLSRFVAHSQKLNEKEQKTKKRIEQSGTRTHATFVTRKLC